MAEHINKMHDDAFIQSNILCHVNDLNDFIWLIALVCPISHDDIREKLQLLTFTILYIRQ